MDIVAVIVALVIGAIAGWLAGVIVEGGGFGLLGNMLLGIVGDLGRGGAAPDRESDPAPRLGARVSYQRVSLAAPGRR